MIARILFAAILAGIAAGVFVTAVQAYKVVPLILEAETYESGSAGGHDHGSTAEATTESGHDHGTGLTIEDGLERTAFTLLTNVLTGVAFGFLLTAAIMFSGRTVSLGEGVIWGIAGFTAFSLAPSMGLPPELPGMPAADLVDRQIWWWITVVLTAGGLGLLILTRSIAPKVLGVGLIVAPHVMGAPQAGFHETAVPATLAAEFATATIVMSALFWVVLGGAAGWFLGRDTTPNEA